MQFVVGAHWHPSFLVWLIVIEEIACHLVSVLGLGSLNDPQTIMKKDPRNFNPILEVQVLPRVSMFGLNKKDTFRPSAIVKTETHSGRGDRRK